MLSLALLGFLPLTALASGQPAAPVSASDRTAASGADPVGADATARVRYGWPLAPPHPVLRPFQPPTTPYGPGHRGVDLGGQAGEPVLAAGDGVIIYAGRLVDRSLVSIEHFGGLRTTYEPIAPVVKVGQRVRRGQLIGHLQPGHPGCPIGSPSPSAVPSARPSPSAGGAPAAHDGAPACLHWGAHRGIVYLDPLRLVSAGTVRLLPWRQEDPP
ncbi:MAG: M23 family metallopeptidase [Sciscionella sp.]|nr:M23 family metallopeptidase [Sciscionella sp.]